MEELQKIAQEKMFNFQRETVVQFDLPSNFKDWAHKALRHHSMSQLKLEPDQYREIIGKEPKQYSLLDISMFLNMMHGKSPEHMSMELEDYADFQEIVILLSEKWKAIVEPEGQRIKNETEGKARVSDALDSVIDAGQRKTIPLGQA